MNLVQIFFFCCYFIINVIINQEYVARIHKKSTIFVLINYWPNLNKDIVANNYYYSSDELLQKIYSG